MTSTAGTDGHPEVAEISALSEGLLSPQRSADLRGHISSCALCADVRDSLNEIRDLLGTLPGPPRMPGDIAGRIDAALAAEALIDATAPGAPAGVARESRVSRETSPNVEGPSGHAPASTGPGRQRPRRRWGRVVLATAGVAAVLGGGGVYVQSLVSTGTSHGSATASAQPPGTFSGTSLQTRVHQLLAAPSNAPRTGGEHAGNTPMSTEAPTVPPCVLRGTGRSDQPLGSVPGTYEGRSTYLLVLPHPSDTARVDAYVVDASCASTSSSASGQVLARETYTRG